MDKINNFKINKIAFRAQEKAEEKPKTPSEVTDEQKPTGAEAALANQGRAQVGMQNNHSLTLEGAQEKLRSAILKRDPKGQYMEDYMSLTQDENEKTQISKLEFLTELFGSDQLKDYDILICFNKIEWDKGEDISKRQTTLAKKTLENNAQATTFYNYFDAIEWNADISIIDRQLRFVNKLLDSKCQQNENYSYIIKKMHWAGSEDFVNKQIDFLLRVKQDGSLDYCNKNTIFNNIAWDKDDDFLEKQIDFGNTLLENKNIGGYGVASLFELIWYQDEDDIAKKQMAFLSKLSLNEKLSYKDMKNIFERINWNDEAELLDKKIDILCKLAENKELKCQEILDVFDRMQCDKGFDFTDSQISYLDELFKNKKLSTKNAAKLFCKIAWSRDDSFIEMQKTCLNRLLTNENVDGPYIYPIFNKISWHRGERHVRDQIDFLNKLLKDERFKSTDINAVFTGINWNNDGSPNENQLKLVNELLFKDHKDSDKKWPTFEESIQILSFELTTCNSSSDMINYNQDTTSIVYEIMQEMNLDGVDDVTKKRMEKIITRAIKNPRQYLDNIPSGHTETETYKDAKAKPKRSYKIKDEELPDIIKESYRRIIASFFLSECGESFQKIFYYLDNEAIQAMIDKRLEKFAEELGYLSKLTENNRVFIKELFEKNNQYEIAINGQKQTRPLAGSGSRKIELTYMILALQNLKSKKDLSKMYNATEDNTNGKINLSKDGVIDFDKISRIIYDGILEKAEVSKKEMEESGISKSFNGKYMYSVAIEGVDDDLKNIIKAASCGKFESLIEDTNNEYGKANQETAKAFKEHEMSFERWTNPKLDDLSFNLRGNKMTIKLWNRDPFEDLFVGNKTSCCTAIGAFNGEYSSSYLLNKAFNVIELYNEKGEVIGMSRVYMANVNGENSLVMDNIELNSNYGAGKTTDQERREIRDNFFKYIREYAKQVTGKDDTPIYFSTEYSKVPSDDLKKKGCNIKFIGSTNKDEIYMNVVIEAVSLKKDINTNLYIVPKAA